MTKLHIFSQSTKEIRLAEAFLTLFLLSLDRFHYFLVSKTGYRYRSDSVSLSCEVRIVIVIVIVSALLISCGSQKTVTQLVTDIRKDTVYINAFQQDSVYIYENKLIDRSRDTIYIRDKSIEFRYRKLRDTVRISKCDSIPYEVRITETKEVRYIPPWFKFLSLIGAISILLVSFLVVTKLKHTDLI